MQLLGACSDVDSPVDESEKVSPAVADSAPPQSERDGLALKLEPLIRVVVEAARTRQEVRAGLAALGEWLLSLIKPAAPEPQPQAPPAGPSKPAPTTSMLLTLGGEPTPVNVPGTPQEVAAAQAEFRRVRGQPAAEAARPSAAAEAGAAPDLTLIAKRCALKAECCRWAITRRQRLAQDAPFETAIKPTDRDLVARAKALSDCSAWVLDPYAALPDDRALQDMAACYENLGAAAELNAELLSHEDADEFRQDAYYLLAEAQSALRKATRDAEAQRPDRDQEEVFRWLRIRTYEDHVFVQRHMRLDDPADPAHWRDLQYRINEMRRRIDSARTARRERKNLLGKLRYLCGRLPEPSSPEAHGVWTKIVQTTDELIAAGVKPSDRELREILLPVFEEIPDSLEASARFEEVLESVDRFLADQEARQRAPEAEPEPSAQVKRVAEALRGRVALLIGGQRRPHSQRMLERDLQLKELRWIATNPHTSLSSFEPQIARPEVGLVLLAVRWRSHSFEGVKALCEKYRKSFVRLPAGYGSNRVAEEILRQASDRLIAQA